MDQEDYRFEIAISFAGDNKRDLVRKVAVLLQEKVGKGKVFFDEWFESELAGTDAHIVLQNYYQKKTRLVVTCVCKRYNEKPWTQEEWRAIQAFERDLRDAGSGNVKRMRFLPLRFGDGEIDGLFSTAIVPDVRSREPKEIAELILKRLDHTKPESGEQIEEIPVEEDDLISNSAAHHDKSKAKSPLRKVRSYVDIESLKNISSRNYKRASIATAIIFLFFAVAGFVYYKIHPEDILEIAPDNDTFVQGENSSNDLLMKTIYLKLVNYGRAFVSIQSNEKSQYDIQQIRTEAEEQAKQASLIPKETLSTNRKLTQLAYAGFGYGLSAQAKALNESIMPDTNLREADKRKISQNINMGLDYLNKAIGYYNNTSNYSKYPLGSKEYDVAKSFKEWATGPKQGIHTYPRFLRYQKAILLSVNAWLDSDMGRSPPEPDAIKSVKSVIDELDKVYLQNNPAKDVVFLAWMCSWTNGKIGAEICTP